MFKMVALYIVNNLGRTQIFTRNMIMTRHNNSMNNVNAKHYFLLINYKVKGDDIRQFIVSAPTPPNPTSTPLC